MLSPTYATAAKCITASIAFLANTSCNCSRQVKDSSMCKKPKAHIISMWLSLSLFQQLLLVGIKQKLCLYILRLTGHNTFRLYSLPHVSLWVIEEEMKQNENGYSLAVTKIHIEELQVARLWEQGAQHIYSSHVPPWQIILQTVEEFGSRALQTVNIIKWHYQQVPFMTINFSSQIQWKHRGCLWKNGM